MPSISLIMDGDGAFKEELDATDPAKFIHLDGETPLKIAFLEGGMASGKPSVAIGAPLPDGGYLIVETSLEAFVTAGRGLQARSER